MGPWTIPNAEDMISGSDDERGGFVYDGTQMALVDIYFITRLKKRFKSLTTYSHPMSLGNNYHLDLGESCVAYSNLSVREAISSQRSTTAY